MSISIIDGGANTALTRHIARVLGAPLLGCVVARFPDGEARVQLTDPVVGDDVFISSRSAYGPTST